MDVKEALVRYEICKRIADIEGVQYTVENPQFGIEHLQPVDDIESIYNPLTDDALCFQLMVKYEVNVDSYLGVTSISSDYTNKPNIAQVSYMDYTINKAICLTIIEANKI